MALDKQAFQSYQQKPVEKFIKALDESLWLRRVTGLERSEMVALLESKGKANEAEDTLEHLCSFGIANPDGSRMFDHTELQHIARMPLDALTEIMGLVLEVNALTKQAADEAKGNSSGPDQKDDSSSALPESLE